MDSNILDWIKTQKESGNSENQIRQALLKQGYAETEVNDALTKNFPFSINFAIAMGIGFFSLILAGIASFMMLFLESIFFAIIITLVIGVFMGYYIVNIRKSTNTGSKTSIWLGILSPLPSVAFIYTALFIGKKLSAQLTQQISASQAGAISSVFQQNIPDALLMSILFYVLSNVFVVRDAIKNNETSGLKLYGFGIILLAIILTIVWRFATLIIK